MASMGEDFGHDGILEESVSRSDNKFTRDAYLEVGKRNTKFRIVSFAQEQIPKPLLLGFLLQFSNDGNDCVPALNGVIGQLGMRKLSRGKDLVLYDSRI